MRPRTAVSLATAGVVVSTLTFGTLQVASADETGPPAGTGFSVSPEPLVLNPDPDNPDNRIGRLRIQVFAGADNPEDAPDIRLILRGLRPQLDPRARTTAQCNEVSDGFLLCDKPAVPAGDIREFTFSFNLAGDSFTPGVLPPSVELIQLVDDPADELENTLRGNPSSVIDVVVP